MFRIEARRLDKSASMTDTDSSGAIISNPIIGSNTNAPDCLSNCNKKEKY